MTSCELCANYEYDDETAQYACAVSLDMDEYDAFLRGNYRDCPYYDPGGEYALVRKQN